MQALLSFFGLPLNAAVYVLPGAGDYLITSTGICACWTT